ncbi:MAG: hypothetical protein WCB58_07445, partial [Acidobacteriaceae bacterium]
LSTAPDGLRVYAVQKPDGRVTLTALNLSLDHPIELALEQRLTGKQLIRLRAPSATAKTGETLADAAIGADGARHANSHESTGARLQLPAASAALIYS